MFDGHHLPALVRELIQHILLQPPAEGGGGDEWGEGEGRCGGYTGSLFSAGDRAAAPPGVMLH